MRIVQVSPYDLAQHGGVQQHILSLAGELRARGHEVLVIGPGEDCIAEAGNLRLGRKRRISFAGTSFELSLASSRELAALEQRFADWKPDVVHYHTMWVPFLPWQIFRRTRLPSVATFHDTPPTGPTGVVLRTLFKALSRYLLRRLDGAIAVSPAPMGHLRPGRDGVVPVVLPPATNLSPFFAMEKCIPPGPPTVLSIGRLEPRKGIGVLLEAWSMIASGMVRLPAGLAMPQLIVAGSGELEELVRSASQDTGNAVLHHIPAPDDERMRALLKSATVVASPAIYGESFGIVLVEALATGTPVVAAANAGYVNVLTGDGQDLLVPPGNARALAERILGLLADAGRRASLARWGRDHARQFDIAARASDFESVYRAAIERHARSKAQGSGSQR
jgi:phosphatidylinositol alpha-mannosyltransferase